MLPLAVAPRQHAGRPCRAAERPRRSRRPRARGHDRPTRRSVSATSSVRSSPPSTSCCGGLAEEHGRRGRADHARRGAAARTPRAATASRRRPRRRRRSESPVYTDGMPAAVQRALAQSSVLVPARRSPRRRRRRTGSPSNVGAAASSAPTSSARSLPMWSRQSADRARSEFRRRPNVSRCTTRSRNGSPRGAPASREPGWPPRRRARRSRGSPSAAPRSTRLQRVDEQRVAAPVGAERRLGARGLGGLEVGDDVAAAEGVDRLLRVADQHQRRRGRGRRGRAPPTAPGRCPGTRRPARCGQRWRIRCRGGRVLGVERVGAAGSAGRRSRGRRGGACAVSSSARTCFGEADAAPRRVESGGGSSGRSCVAGSPTDARAPARARRR